MLPDDIDWNAYLADENDGRADVRPASEFFGKVIDRFHGEQQERYVGALTPWASVGHNLAFRAGETTLWSGVNGHGKSGVTGQTILGFLAQGERACIASMEMAPETTLERMAKQAACQPKPAKAYLEALDRWTDGKLWIYNQTGTVPRDRMISVARYCRKELGVNHMVIDSLMKCGIAPDDYAGQKAFVDALCSLGRDTGLHIHLVHHIRKGERETNAPDKFDIKGAGEITDLVDNVLIVHRNKRKEDALRSDTMKDDERAKFEAQADTILICAKQRHFTWEGKIKLWFDTETLQFRDDKNVTSFLDLRTGQWNTQWGLR
jgi:twinkle protein